MLTGVGRDDESTCHLWKLFRWWFPSRHRLRSRWFFPSQQGLQALPNPHITFWKVFRWWFLSRHRTSFRWLFMSQLGLLVLTNPRVTFGIGFVDNFGDGSGSVFINNFWVNRGWARWRIHALPLEVVSLMISQSAPTQFSLTFSESTGAASTSESTPYLSKVFRWWFLSRQRLNFRWLFVSQQGLWALTNPQVIFRISFVDDFRDCNGLVFINFFYVNRGWARWRIHASPLEVVSLMISQSPPTPFSLTFSESKGVASPSESTRLLWKVFRGMISESAAN